MVISKALLTSIVAVLGAVAAFIAGTNVTVAPTDTAFGAVSSPDIASPYLSVNGVTFFYNRQAMKTGTTTICSFKTPSSTSTLEDLTVSFGRSSTTASVVTIARASTAFATTTIMGNQVAIAANAQAQIVGSTTIPAAILAPNTFINVGMQGGTGTMSPIGSCQAVFLAL